MTCTHRALDSTPCLLAADHEGRHRNPDARLAWGVAHETHTTEGTR